MDKKLKFLRPVHEKFPISSPFGMRNDPFKHGENKMHNGVDFACPEGTDIRAVEDCTVFKSGWESEVNKKQGFGLRVWAEMKYEGDDYYFWYGHLSKILVADGQKVKKGEVIGSSGNTGSSTGAHLHVQARKRNTGQFFDMEFYA